MRLLLHRDIRLLGDRNAGAANAARLVGRKLGFAVGTVDVAKGMLVVLTARSLDDSTISPMIAGVAVVAGHNWPLFLMGRGGRGAAPAAGVLLALVPYVAIPLVLPGLLVLYVTRSATKTLAFFYILTILLSRLARRVLPAGGELAPGLPAAHRSLLPGAAGPGGTEPLPQPQAQAPARGRERQRASLALTSGRLIIRRKPLIACTPRKRGGEPIEPPTGPPVSRMEVHRQALARQPSPKAPTPTMIITMDTNLRARALRVSDSSITRHRELLSRVATTNKNRGRVAKEGRDQGHRPQTGGQQPQNNRHYGQKAFADHQQRQGVATSQGEEQLPPDPSPGKQAEHQRHANLL